MDDEPPVDLTQAAPGSKRRRWLAMAVLALFAMIALAVVAFDSPVGHRFVAERIARYAPVSGLRVDVGRIEGSVFSRAVLHDLTLSDPQGPFLRVPRAELDWRPFSWFTTGLDVRRLVLSKGTLIRRPRLRPGDPDAPILPGFDIRIDSFRIEQMTIPRELAGQPRQIDLGGRIDIHQGRALVRAEAQLGERDRLLALIDAEPDRDRFDLKLDLAAKRGGVLAGLAQTDGDLEAVVAGKGTWQRWDGGLLAQQGGKRIAALKLTNQSGRYRVAGLVWPTGWLGGIAARAAGSEVAVRADLTFEQRVLDGTLDLTGQGVAAQASGGIDLTRNRVNALAVTLVPLHGDLLGERLTLANGRLQARLDGPLRDLTIEHSLLADSLVIKPSTRIEGLVQQGAAHWDGVRLTVPLDARARRIVTGNAQFDPYLANAIARGTLLWQGKRLESDDLTLGVPGLGAKLALRGDITSGIYGVAGPVAARALAVPNLGRADADATIALSLGGASGWSLRGNLAGRMERVDNPTLTTIAGTGIRFGGRFAVGQGQPLLLDSGTLSGSKLAMGLAGRRLADGRTILVGKGRQSDYGPFTLDANLGAGGPRAVLVFASPLPAAGLSNVRVALAPIKGGFRLETQGGSRLGSFSGVIGLFASSGQPVRLAIERFSVWQTAVTGSLQLSGGRASGLLNLSGGGLDGTVRLAPRGGGQGFDLALTARGARFGGDNPISLASGRIEGGGLIAAGHTSFTGRASGEGLAQGALFVGRFAFDASITDGRGRVNGSLTGRRGSRFSLNFIGDINPQQIAIVAAGDLAGRRISMPRRAVFTAERGGWRLAPSQVDFGGGRAVVSGLFGANGSELDLALADMPLSLADIYYDDLGFGGAASGTLRYRVPQRGLPTGEAVLRVRGLTRSGLVLTSRPLDLALNASLTGSQLDLRATAQDGSAVRGRLQARIAALPAQGTLAQRLGAGALLGQLRYAGPADALWRLIALEAFDLTGDVALAADVTGSLNAPQFRGSLASSDMRLRSALIGSDITGIAVQGRFSGSRLDITGFSGRAGNGGQVSGSGTIDLAGLGQRAPSIDLRLAAQRAQILSRDDMAATVTGPLRIVSDGVQGTIAGRLAIDAAHWRLGRATAASALPSVRTREINQRGDVAAPRALAAPWRFLIDARGSRGIAVDGLGIDSEWSADIRIRGTTEAPALGGRADLVRGGYEFAGRRFEMQRGRITFDGASPPNPRLDIVAEANVTGLSARVTVTGSSFAPQIAFTSTPALPEDELLSRLLFGTSITNISAPEAIQLGAALASLRGSGGLDPINRLRAAIGLDRLRVVSADATLGRSTGIAVGKYLGRRFYAEIISDGRGYSATQLEFRLTNWLAVLASVSTVGRESINVRVSKDY